MQSKKFILPLTGLTVFLIGYFLPAPVGGASSQLQLQSFLTELHLHGSLSEGRATMWHHSESPANSGVDYDVLWWTDHMGRVTSQAFPQAVNFNDSLFAQEFSNGVVRFHKTEPFHTEVGIGGTSDKYAKFMHTGFSSTGWTAGGGYLETTGESHRISLMANPEIRLDLRISSFASLMDTNVVIRVTLSSRKGDGTDDLGVPNILEYINFDLQPPELNVGKAHNTVQIPKFDARGPGFTSITLKPISDARTHFYEKSDLSIIDIEVLAACRNGERLRVDLDNFELSVDASFCNKNLFVAAERLVHSGKYPYSNLTQHIGMELAGPKEQKITDISTRDHVIALYRDKIENSISQIYDFVDTGMDVQWPQDGIDRVHTDNGVAVLAHIFSSIASGEIPEENARILADRVVSNDAWGADAIEVGYQLRGAPLETFVDVWDRLSENRVYITGVGVSDHHNTKDWSLRTNNMGTWIKAISDSPANLADSIQSGYAFFGDPYQFDSFSGELDFGISGSTAKMGAVYSISHSKSLRFFVSIEGAHSGDDLVWIHNGEEIFRTAFSGSNIEDDERFRVNPGDWVRVEVRDNANKAYLFSNPIYIVRNGDYVPPHRAP